MVSNMAPQVKPSRVTHARYAPYSRNAVAIITSIDINTNNHANSNANANASATTSAYANAETNADANSDGTGKSPSCASIGSNIYE